MKYFINAFKQFAEFNGRATRTEYWMFVLFYVISVVILSVIDAALGAEYLTTIFTLVALIPNISLGARRLHDTGRTGWWQLIGLIPLLGAIVLLIFFVQESHEANEYGAKPRII